MVTFCIEARRFMGLLVHHTISFCTGQQLVVPAMIVLATVAWQYISGDIPSFRDDLWKLAFPSVFVAGLVCVGLIIQTAIELDRGLQVEARARRQAIIL